MMAFVPVGIDENSDLPQEVRERLAATTIADVVAGALTLLTGGLFDTVELITRTAYDALTPPDDSTLYLIDETS